MPQIEIYGQNEIIEAVKDQRLIHGIVDRLFVYDKAIITKIEEAYARLRENSAEINNLMNEYNNIEDKTADLPSLKERLRFYTEAGLEEKLPLLTRLASEEAVYDQVKEQCDSIKPPRFPKVTVESNEDAVITSLREIAESFNKRMEELGKEYERALSDLDKAYRDSRSSWEQKRAENDDEIRNALKTVDGIQDKSGNQIASEYTELLKKVRLAEPIQKRSSEIQRKIDDLKKNRKTLIESCRKALDEYSEYMNRQLKKLNKKFGNTIRLSIKYRQNKERVLEELKSINGIGDKGLAGIVQYDDFDIFSFVEDIRSGIDRIKSKYNLTAGNADKIVNGFDEQDLYRMEEFELEDVFQIELFVNGQFKALQNLSKGQQCTAILNVLLVDNRDPLIVDQPEDNLDNAFIADSLITTIRDNKIKRQYIFATHNANIPVFGDAELIIAMTEVDGAGRISNDGIGSIDVQTVKEKVINILEGGRAAFIMREEKYGL